jgi:hypothetical protein
MNNAESDDLGIQRRIQVITWVLRADAILVAAVAGLLTIFASGVDRLLLVPGAITVAVLSYSIVNLKKAGVGGFADHPLLISITVVNFVFFGWYAGEILTNILGPMSRAAALFLNAAVMLIFGLAIVLPYWNLNRIRLEGVDSPPNLSG